MNELINVPYALCPNLNVWLKLGMPCMQTTADPGKKILMHTNMYGREKRGRHCYRIISLWPMVSKALNIILFSNGSETWHRSTGIGRWLFIVKGEINVIHQIYDGEFILMFLFSESVQSIAKKVIGK